MKPWEHFTLKFDPNYSHAHPDGYWTAASSNGDYDAAADTPLNALAKLVVELDVALTKMKSREEQ